jgi:hypothetical protein
MRQGITLFEQVQARLPRLVVAQAVAATQGDYKVQVATCWSQVLCLMLAVLTRQRSLRHIGQSLQPRFTYLRRFGVGSLDRSTLSHAGAQRPAAVAEALFQALLVQCRQIAPRHAFRFQGRLYSLDATVIHVCHTLHRWAVWAPERAGIKLHVALDHDGDLPTWVDVTSARVYERTTARRWNFPEGSVLCVDRGYFDSGWFRDLVRRKIIFVTRWAYGARYRVVNERPVAPDGKVRADQDIRFAGKTSRTKFHGVLRLITYRDPDTNRTFQFVTNQRRWNAQLIADIYQARWRIELFFKWLKQQLPVLHFYGQSKNAARWQLYIALCVYLLLSWIKFQHRLEQSLTAIARRIEPHLFDRAGLDDLLHGTYQFQT